MQVGLYYGILLIMNEQQPFSSPSPIIPKSVESEVTRGEMKRSRAVQAIRRGKTKKLLWVLVAIVIVAGFVIGGIKYSRSRAVMVPGEVYADDGQEHVSLTRQFTYSSNPPSSGPHYGSPASWGIYDYEVNDKFFIHNLEHGGVWIAYRPDIPAEVVAELGAIVDEYGGSKFVMAPRSGNDTDIAIAAWNRVYKFDLSGSALTESEKEQIHTFYRARKNKGPEFVPDTMPGVDPKSVK